MFMRLTLQPHTSVAKHTLLTPQKSTKNRLAENLPNQGRIGSPWNKKRFLNGGKKDVTPPKFNSSPLKIDGERKTTFFLGWLIFRGELLNFQGVKLWGRCSAPKDSTQQSDLLIPDCWRSLNPWKGAGCSPFKSGRYFQNFQILLVFTPWLKIARTLQSWRLSRRISSKGI